MLLRSIKVRLRAKVAAHGIKEKTSLTHYRFPLASVCDDLQNFSWHIEEPVKIDRCKFRDQHGVFQSIQQVPPSECGMFQQ
jgi:hypothetical protein